MANKEFWWLANDVQILSPRTRSICAHASSGACNSGAMLWVIRGPFASLRRRNRPCRTASAQQNGSTAKMAVIRSIMDVLLWQVFENVRPTTQGTPGARRPKRNAWSKQIDHPYQAGHGCLPDCRQDGLTAMWMTKLQWRPSILSLTASP